MKAVVAGLLMGMTMAQGVDVRGSWNLSALEKGGSAITMPMNEQGAFVEFRESELSGNTGCNNFFGSYEIRGNQLNMSENVGMTRMMCAPANMAVEDALIQIFTAQSTIQIHGNTLILENRNVRATFTR